MALTSAEMLFIKIWRHEWKKLVVQQTSELSPLQISVTQNSADGSSPLECSPSCPQEEGEKPSSSSSSRRQSSGRKKNRKPSGGKRLLGAARRNKITRKANSKTKLRKRGKQNKVSGRQKERLGDAGGCPGAGLEKCVDGCPGKFGARVFAACVKTCGKRC